MQNGAPMWEAADFLGMSEKTLRETYGHHHPDFLKGASAWGDNDLRNRINRWLFRWRRKTRSVHLHCNP